MTVMSDSDEDDHSYSSAIADAATISNNAIANPNTTNAAIHYSNSNAQHHTSTAGGSGSSSFALHQCIFAGDIRRLSQLLRTHDVAAKDKHGTCELGIL